MSVLAQCVMPYAAGLIACCVVYYQPAIADAAIIELKGQAGVSTAVVQLGQVAQIHDADEKLTARLSAATLFPTPAPGRSKTVDFETIRNRLVSLGFNTSDLEFSGSSQVTVSGSRAADADGAGGDSANADLARRRADEMVAKAIRQLLQTQAPALGNVQVELQLSPKQIGLLNSAASARVEVYGGKDPWVGHQTFRAAFYDRQGQRQEYQVTAVIQPLPQVIVASSNLPKGHVVQAEDVKFQQQPLTAVETPLFDREELVVGQETKRRLRVGEPIAVGDVRGVPLVRRGDMVTVVARGGGIVVRTDAKATMDGGLGQEIRLTSLDGRRELSARVSGYHEATVSAGNGQPPPTKGTGIRILTGEPAR